MTKAIRTYTGRESRKIRIFQMRFEGYTYREISKTKGINMNEYTLQGYFCSGGKWHEEYKEWVRQRIDDINEQMSSMFTAQAVEAMQKIVNLSKGHASILVQSADGEAVRVPIKVGDRTMLDAAKDIVDRAGFKPPERIKFDNAADDQAEDMMKALEELKLKKEHQTQSNDDQ